MACPSLGIDVQFAVHFPDAQQVMGDDSLSGVMAFGDRMRVATV